MIQKKNILKNLRALDELYNSSVGLQTPQLFAKLAILEVSGWVEECMDSIVLGLSAKQMVPLNYNYYNDNTVRFTSGFHYNKHIRNKLLKDLLGYVLIERLEAALAANQSFLQMKASLDALYHVRNSNAHTHLTGITPTIVAPSVSIKYLEDVHGGFLEMNKQLKKIKFK